MNCLQISYSLSEPRIGFDAHKWLVLTVIPPRILPTSVESGRNTNLCLRESRLSVERCESIRKDRKEENAPRTVGFALPLRTPTMPFHTHILRFF